jgi:hypothetical protein
MQALCLHLLFMADGLSRYASLFLDQGDKVASRLLVAGVIANESHCPDKPPWSSLAYRLCQGETVLNTVFAPLTEFSFLLSESQSVKVSMFIWWSRTA